MSKSSASVLFSLRLKNAREARGLSQGELASRSGLQASAISHFESGSRRPSFANLRKLADALEVSTDYLLGRSENLSGEPTADVMFRNYDRLSVRDRETIRMLTAQMAEKRGKGEGGGEGT